MKKYYERAAHIRLLLKRWLSTKNLRPFYCPDIGKRMHDCCVSWDETWTNICFENETLVKLRTKPLYEECVRDAKGMKRDL